jgi:hypothetical protein
VAKCRPLMTVAVSPDMKVIATKTRQTDASHLLGMTVVRLRDLTTCTEKARLELVDHEMCLTWMSFSDNGRFLIGAFHDLFGHIMAQPARYIIWDTHSGLQQVATCPLLPVVSPSERWALCPDKSGADLRGTDPQRQYARLQVGENAGAVWEESAWEFSPDSRMVVGAGLYVARTTNPVEMILSRQWSKINTKQTSWVGCLWDVESGEEIAAFPDCRKAIFLPNGRALATVDGDNRLQLWTVPPRRPYGPILALTTATWGLALLIAWRVKRRFQRWRRSSISEEARLPVLPPKGGAA